MTCQTCGDTGKIRAREFPTVYIDCQDPTHNTMTTPYQIIAGTDLSVLQFQSVQAGMAERFGPMENDYIYSHQWYFNGKSFMGIWK